MPPDRGEIKSARHRGGRGQPHRVRRHHGLAVRVASHVDEDLAVVLSLRYWGRAVSQGCSARRGQYGWPPPPGRSPHPQDARLHPETSRPRVAEFPLSAPPQGNDTMTAQATTHRTPSLPHAYILPVVPRLPSLPSAALGWAQTW